jgi:TetR/AcrR family transcriptional regulator, tetracycline repressor protein
MSKPGNYTRTDVVDTALRLLDKYGLADLSMRRLAAELDVQPSALYWHVPNKQTLLALVSDQIIGRALEIDHGQFITDSVVDWKAVTLAESKAIRDALLAFRDGAEVVSSTLALGLGAHDALTRIRTGLDYVCESIDRGPEIAAVAADSILFLILGQVWHEQQRMSADSLGVAAPAAQSKPEDFAAAETRFLPEQKDSLAFGIELILDGLEQKFTLAG